jgi:hypothetical protein
VSAVLAITPFLGDRLIALAFLVGIGWGLWDMHRNPPA